MTDCPTENALLELSEGLLAPEAAEAVRVHADGCGDCRAVLAALMDSSPAAEAGAQVDEGGEPLALNKGDAVDRYLILERLGSGGMSVVHAAFDPQLNRRIAIKVLRTDQRQPDHEERKARLLREAQSIARLSHPNVVGVHDAGTLDGRVWLAMELVDGETLAEWCRRQPRDWEAIRRVFTEAGRGLGAAHRAGLVHRDFKPDNVLIARDGAVRVTDFGLAREVEDQEISRDEVPSGATDFAGPSELTRWDAIVGTPAYMAPEQITRSAVDGRADQFSFCVTLYEALYGVRPFAGKDLVERLRAMKRFELCAPVTEPKVPSWVRRALLRGLSFDPADRFPSIDALLEALRVDPGARLRRGAAWASVAALLTAAVAAEVWFIKDRAAARCSGAHERLAGVWDSATRARVEAALSGAGGAFGAQAFAAVAVALDGYTAAWIDERIDACLATRERREQSEAAMDARMACLDDRLADVRALTRVLADADGQVAQKAPEAARALRSVSPCRDVAALMARTLPPDETVRAAVEALNREFSEIKALHDAGRFVPALEKARRAHATAEALGYPPSLARALQLLGMTELQRAFTSDAERHLFEAISTATAIREDEVAAAAWLSVVKALADRKAKQEEVELLADLAAAALARVGTPPELEISRLVALARHSLGTSKPERALELNLRALRLAEASAHPLFLFRASSAVGSALCELQRCEEALQYHDRAAQLASQTLGPLHPETAAVLDAMATSYRGVGRFEDALRIREQGMAVIERLMGPDNLRTALAVQRAALVHAEVGNFPHALRLFQRALDIRTRAAQRVPHLLASSHNNLALVHYNLGDFAEAERSARRALVLYEEAYGAGAFNTHSALVNLLGALVQQKRSSEAKAVLARLQRVFDTLKPDSPRRLDYPRLVARVAIEEGRYADALRAMAPLVGAPRDGEPGRDRALDLMLIAQAHLGLGQRSRAAPLLAEAGRFPANRLTPLEFAQLRLLLATTAPEPSEASALATEGRARLAPLPSSLEVDRLRRDLARIAGAARR